MGNLSGETTWLLKSELLDIVPKGFLAYTAAYNLVRNSKTQECVDVAYREAIKQLLLVLLQ